jgi:hypothetical protein
MLSAMWSPSRYVIVGKMDNLYYCVALVSYCVACVAFVSYCVVLDPL